MSGRRYLDPDNVVHDASDLGLGTRITLCEREANADWFDGHELRETQKPTTCLLCLVAPEWRRRQSGHDP